MSDSLKDYAVKGCPPTSVPQSQFNSDNFGRHRNRRIDEYNGDEKIGYRGGGCFSGDTNISTPFGCTKIAQLKSSEWVLSINRRTGKLEPQQILRVKRYENCETWLLLLEGNIKIKTTASHSFQLNNIWTKARDIAVNDCIQFINSSGEAANKIVLHSRPSQNQESVFNLIINKNFNYIANGVLVHSFTYFRKLRRLLWSIRNAKNHWAGNTGHTVYDQDYVKVELAG